MQSSYIYSGTLAHVLTARLLTEAQRELLLGSTSVSDVHTILQDTKMGPFLHTAVQPTDGIEQFRVSVKESLLGMTTDPQVLAVLFLRYDYANLKRIRQQHMRGLGIEDVEHTLSNLGMLSPKQLVVAITKNHTDDRYTSLLSAYTSSEKLQGEASLGDHFDYAYLTHMRDIARQYPHTFVERYSALCIDLHNINTHLRILAHGENANLIVAGTFVPGGTITKDTLSHLETAIKTVRNFSRNGAWQKAVDAYVERKDFTELDRESDNYLMQFLRRESIEIHSPASLFAYFHTVLEHTQFVEAIIGAHNAGLDGPTLRTLLRTSFTQHDF